MVLRLKLLIVKSLLSAMVLKQKIARIGYDLENKSTKIRIDGNSSVNVDLSNSEKIAVLSGGSKYQ